MFERRILHFSPGPDDFVGSLSERAVAGCWFELHRQGGCGAGELRLYDGFHERDAVDVGDWIALEYAEGDRWYFGRVEHRQATTPAGVSLRLEGTGVELGEVFPGGFGREVADGVPPHRYARTDLFFNDPDYFDETVDEAFEAHEVVSLLMEQYVAPRTHIAFDPDLVESSASPAPVTSFKFRGEESVRAVVKQLALVARNAAWGVDADRTFYFLRPRAEALATYREGVHLTRLEETRERDLLFNRVVLTGDYVYDETVESDVTARGFFRWRGHYIQPASRTQHGERRIRLWVPWIRTQSDSRQFTREFFRIYAQPPTRYLVEVANQPTLPRPWLGRIRIEDRNGVELITAQVETVRVQFDRVPRLRMELGPEDPRTHWPEPPHDERWEIPQEASGFGGDLVTLTSSLGGSSDDGGTSSSDLDSLSSEDFSSSEETTSSEDESSSEELSSSDLSSSEMSSSEEVLSSGDPCFGAILCDSFTDPDGTLLSSHAMEVGPGWTVHSGTWQIASNQGATSSSGEVWAVANAGTDDLELFVDLVTGQTTSGLSIGAIARYEDANNYWFAWFRGGGNQDFRIYERSGGTYISRAGTSKTLTMNTAYSLRVLVEGSLMEAQIGTTMIDYDDVWTGATRVGLRSFLGGTITLANRFDNLKAYAL